MSVEPVIYAQNVTTPRERTYGEIALIAAKHGFTLSDVMGKGRRRKLVHARNEAIRHVYCKMRGKWSSVEVARFFCKDHSTILLVCGRLNFRKPSDWSHVLEEKLRPTLALVESTSDSLHTD